MAEVITKGYLINRDDYELFDEIISFINEYGIIFSVLALGVKKILSKNSRNLFYGCLSEFEIFSSRDVDNKIGKLKKVNLIENNISISFRKPLLLANRFIFINKLKTKKAFLLIKEISNLLLKLNEEYDDILIIYVLILNARLLGLKLELNSCSICNSKKIKSFSNYKSGFVCKKHFDELGEIEYDKNIIELLYLVNNSKFEQAKKINNYWITISIRILMDYIKELAGVNSYKYLFSSNKID